MPSSCSYCGMRDHNIRHCAHPFIGIHYRRLKNIFTGISIQQISSELKHMQFKQRLMQQFNVRELKAVAVKYAGSQAYGNKGMFIESLWSHCCAHIEVHVHEWIEVEHHSQIVIPQIPDQVPAYAQDLEGQEQEQEEQGPTLWVIDRTPSPIHNNIINYNNYAHIRPSQLIRLIREQVNNHYNYQPAEDEYIPFTNAGAVRNLEEELSAEVLKFDIVPLMICETSEDLETTSECVICYEPTKLVDVVVLNCNHQFCQTCIKQTLMKHRKICGPSCALCRQPMSTFTVKNPDTYNAIAEHCK